MCPVRQEPGSTDKLVSIGIPTFNRPELLGRSLEKLACQTWPNIEIIVSDNASTNPQVAQVIEEWSKRDARIRAFRQPSNIGALANFVFVLEQARGSLFMWAADDDDWEPDFIATLSANIGDAGLAMSEFETVFRSTSQVQKSALPDLSPEFGTYENALAFLRNMQPSLVYGVWKTDVLRECVPDGISDFWDCALIFTVLMRHGINTVRDVKYRAGVAGDNYVIKLANPVRGALSYRGLTSTLLKEILNSSSLSFLEKVRLILVSIKTIRSLRRHLNPQVKKQRSL